MVRFGIFNLYPLKKLKGIMAFVVQNVYVKQQLTWPVWQLMDHARCVAF